MAARAHEGASIMAQNPAAKFAQMRGKTPEEAKFFWTGGPVMAAERTWLPVRESPMLDRNQRMELEI